MDDATLFGIGCGVTAIAFGGAYVYMRARFEAMWIEEQPEEATLVTAEERVAAPGAPTEREERPAPPQPAPPPPG